MFSTGLNPCKGKVCGINAHCENGHCVCDDGTRGDPYTKCKGIMWFYSSLLPCLYCIYCTMQKV